MKRIALMIMRTVIIVLTVCTVLLIAFTLIPWDAHEPQRVKRAISKELGIDVSGGNEISFSDTHGGFLGDGMTFTVLDFSDDEALEQIKKNDQWKPFPVDDTVRTLIYGTKDETSSRGPYLTDDERNPLIPDIQDGYYRLIDRHRETDKDIFDRYSFNFTLGVYDSSTDTLYFCRFDT